MAVSPRDLFDSDDPLELVTQFDQYHDVLNKALGNPRAPMSPEQHRVQKAVDAVKASGTLEKSAASDELIESLGRELRRSSGNGSGYLQKDLDLAGPGSTGGLHAYDLEAPAKILVPRMTPLRNRFPRKQGVGTAHELRRITGFTGGQTGGVASFHPGQAETDTETFGSLSLRRGKKISYTGDHITVPFSQFGVSDQVSWAAQFAGQGYQSLQALSSTTALHSAMLLEEKMILGGMGTAAGFSGTLPAPAAPTVTTPAAGAGQTAVTGGTGANVYVVIRATTLWGSSAASAAGNSVFTTGDVIVASWAHVPGATGYDVFVGQAASAPAASALFYVGATTANTLTVQGALALTGRSAADAVLATAYSAGYDGLIPILLDPDQSGYINYLNGPLTSVDPFQNAFAAMWDNNQANPETIWLHGRDRLSISNLLTSSSSASYRITLANSPDSGTNGVVGALATAIQNGVTGALVDLNVHPMIPRGVAPILTEKLPLPDSNVDSAWALYNVQEYLGISWPVIQQTYDYSVFWQGTFVATAPAWSGVIAGITA